MFVRLLPAMRGSRLLARIVGVVCSAEIAAAVIIGGAGAGAIFGLEGALVGAAAVFVAGTYLRHRHTRRHTHHVDQGPRCDPHISRPSSDVADRSRA